MNYINNFSIEELLRDTDSEVEEDGEKDNKKKKKDKKDKKSRENKKGAWIKEGDEEEIVDFLGGSLAKQIMGIYYYFLFIILI